MDPDVAGKEELGMARKRIGVIGGGASGMMAAITAARQGALVTLMEGGPRLGRKLLVTGNGRCNLGNLSLDTSAYYTRSPGRLQETLKRFDNRDAAAFFEGIGVLVKARGEYLYPACQQATAVQDALRYALRALRVEELLDCKAARVWRDEAAGEIRVESGGGTFSFDRVILCCGGQAWPKTGSDGSGYRLARQMGHSLIPVVPALAPLTCREEYFKSVAGVRAQAAVSLWQGERCLAAERGEVQLTGTGLSGIPVFQISRVANYILRQQSEVELRVDFLPDYTQEEVKRLRLSREPLKKGRSVEEYFTGLLHKKLTMLFIRLAGLSPHKAAQLLSGEELERAYGLFKEFRVHAVGSASFDSAQVCAGGVPLGEVTRELESVKVPGVYFAGELLDVDGKCGGYNLHWAWCSGYVAALAAAKKETKDA